MQITRLQSKDEERQSYWVKQGVQLERTKAAELYAERERKLEQRQMEMKQELQAIRTATKKDADRAARERKKIEIDCAGLPTLTAENKQLQEVEQVHREAKKEADRTARERKKIEIDYAGLHALTTENQQLRSSARPETRLWYTHQKVQGFDVDLHVGGTV